MGRSHCGTDFGCVNIKRLLAASSVAHKSFNTTLIGSHLKSTPLGHRILRFIVRTVLPIAIGTLICLLLIEVGIRVVYRIRNWRAEYVMIPYMVRNVGPPPPWSNGLRILQPDDEMIWRGRPHAQQKYLDLFCPM